MPYEIKRDSRIVISRSGGFGQEPLEPPVEADLSILSDEAFARTKEIIELLQTPNAALNRGGAFGDFAYFVSVSDKNGDAQPVYKGQPFLEAPAIVHDLASILGRIPDTKAMPYMEGDDFQASSYLPASKEWGAAAFVKKLEAVEDAAMWSPMRGSDRCSICKTMHLQESFIIDYEKIRYVWSGILKHYIGEHNVRPTAQFEQMVDNVCNRLQKTDEPFLPVIAAVPKWFIQRDTLKK